MLRCKLVGLVFTLYNWTLVRCWATGFRHPMQAFHLCTWKENIKVCSKISWSNLSLSVYMSSIGTNQPWVSWGCCAAAPGMSGLIPATRQLLHTTRLWMAVVHCRHVGFHFKKCLLVHLLVELGVNIRSARGSFSLYTRAQYVCKAKIFHYWHVFFHLLLSQTSIIQFGK